MKIKAVKTKTKMRGRKNQRGFMIFTCYLLMASVLTLVFAYFFRSFNNFRMTDRRLDKIKAQYIAEAAADRAISWFREQRVAPNLQSICQNPSSKLVPFEDTVYGNAIYTVTITADCIRPKRLFWVRATATYVGPGGYAGGSTYESGQTGDLAQNEVLREVRLSILYHDFSRNGWVIDHFDPDTYLSFTANVRGPIHVNGQLHIWGAMGFESGLATPGTSITTSASSIKYWGCGTASDGITPSPIVSYGAGGSINCGMEAYHKVYSGVQLNKSRITFPDPNLSYLNSKSGMAKFANKMWVVLGDGFMKYSTTGPITAANIGDAITFTYPTGFKGFYFTGGTINEPGVIIRGLVSKSMIIGSKYDIGIDGPIKYKCTAAGGTQCDSSDPILGVVSERNIVLLNYAIDNTTDYTTSGTPILPIMRLDGAYMALGGSFFLPPTTFVGYGASIIPLYINGLSVQTVVQGLRLISCAPLHGCSPEGGLGYTINTYADPRLYSMSIPYTPYSLSILSWEVCEGACPTIAVTGAPTPETYPPAAGTLTPQPT